MKIRSITLDNVRRFTDPVTVGPIGDGVTLLCEPNEAGKSTLFDALHALFFIKHGSQTKEIKALRPHSGGGVAVECCLDHEGASWRVHKQWLSKAEARIWCDGTLVHQGDAAEDWLSALVTGEAGGPGGLLWVRQGRVSLKAETRTDAQAELENRRDLLTAISGAMDAVTGGERMDRALARVTADLALLETSTGKPKAGGRWAIATAQVDDLQRDEADLAQTVNDLRQDLEHRRRLLCELADLQDADSARGRQQAVDMAEAALREAQNLAEKVASAKTQADLAAQSFERARDDLKRMSDLRGEAEEAREACTEAASGKGDAADKAKHAETNFREAKNTLDTARQEKSDADAVLRRVIAGEDAERARQNRETLRKRIENAENADAERLKWHARAQTGPDEATVKKIDVFAREFETKRAIRDAAAPKVSVRYDAGAPEVLLADQPLPEGESRPLPEQGRITMPGIGELRIALSDENADQALRNAEATLVDALADGGWADLDALHDAARTRADAAKAAERAADRRDALAPDGIDALKEQLALLDDVATDEKDEKLPDRAAATATVAEAEAKLDRAVETQERTRVALQSMEIALATAETRQTGARQRRERADAAVRDLPKPDPEGDDRRLNELKQAAAKAGMAHAELAAKAPDLDALGARLTRVRNVAEQATKDARRISGELGKIEGRIETRAEEGVEEALEDVRGRLETARATRDRVTFEVEVLRRLRDALETAQKDARETYFEPVANELRPLLADLWDNAELVWSDDTLLPDALVRKGTEESIDVLSGGTQEQIAFLVRLAFARLLAKSGRHAPLILDDALVYSDDDRIEKMFDALHGAADDLQIIVLSCRQRAFRDLGAPSLTFDKLETA